MSEEPKPFKIKRESITSPHFRRIVVDRTHGTVDSIGLLATIISQRQNIEKVYSTEPIDNKESVLETTIECELIIKPEQLKALYVWLGEKMADYEFMYGNIPSPEEVTNKARKLLEEKSKRNKSLK